MFRGRLQTPRESILLGKLGGGGSPGYSEKIPIIQRNNPLSPIILPWKALIFVLFYMIKAILEIPILGIFCLLPVQYLNYDSEIRDVDMNHMALWSTLIIYGHTKKDALQSPSVVDIEGDIFSFDNDLSIHRSPIKIHN